MEEKNECHCCVKDAAREALNDLARAELYVTGILGVVAI